MTDEQLLTAISSMMDEKLEPIKADVAELKQDVAGLKQDVAGLKQDVAGLKQDVAGLKQDVAGLKQDVAGLKQDVAGLKQDVAGLNQDVAGLKQEMISVKDRVTALEQQYRNIQILLEHEVIPQLREIQTCYTSTYRRYVSGVDQIDTLQRDMDVLKAVVEDHSRKLQIIMCS